MKAAGWTLIVLGTLAVLVSWVMPTITPSAGVLNFGLMQDAFSVRLIGLFSVLCGVVLIAAASVAEAVTAAGRAETASSSPSQLKPRDPDYDPNSGYLSWRK